jgi:DNA-binding transcriptional ArsR family regulator
MVASSDIARVAALLAEPARARMLIALMDGQPTTATELAYQARVLPPTASSHLGQLTDAGLLRVDVRGRHRYYRLAGPQVAEAVESLMVVARRDRSEAMGITSDLQAMRAARTCYDHLAGKLGVLVTRSLVKRRYLAPDGRNFRVTRAGEAFFERAGVEVEKARRQRRVFARECIDWSEHRPHLAGALGAALATRCLDQKWVKRVPRDRSLTVTTEGMRGLRKAFGVAPAHLLP